MEGLEGFRLSPQQERLWRLAASAGTAAGYRAWCVAAIDGPLDRAALEAALALAVERHELLRTSFRTLPGLAAPLQVPVPPGPLSRLPDPLSGRGGEAEEVIEELLASPFDLAGGPLLRWSLLPREPQRHLLLLALPALLSDAVGLDNLVGEIARCYAAAVAGTVPADEPVQSVDLSEWQHELLESEETEAGRDFWRRQPATPETPELSLAVSAPPGAGSPRRLALPLPPELPRLAASWEVSAGCVLLAGWQALLWQLTGRPESLAVAVSFAGRRFEELREAPGLFARDLPVPARLEPGLRLRDLAVRLDRAVSDVAEWQEYVAPAGVPDLPFAFEERPPAGRYQAAGLTFSVLRRDAVHDGAVARLIADAGSLELRYDSARLPEPAARLLAERLTTLFAGAAADPGAVLADLPLVGPEERRLLLEEWNDTHAAFAGAPLLHRLVEEQATRTPERVAVESASGRWTYAELDARATALARRLRHLGVGPESRVAVCLDRSPAMVAALLAVWKAGGAYVPLDPAYPQERLRLMLDDARPALLLTGPGAPPDIALPHLPSLDLGADPGSTSGVGFDADSGQGDLAYILYTSGSTGRPKGVMVSHRAIANRLLWMAAAFPLAADDAVLQKTPFGFDASIWELFLPLLTGARLVMAAPGAHQDPAALTRAVAAHGVTVLQLVPSLLGPFLDAEGIAGCRTLRRLFCGGEPLTPALRDLAFARLGAELCNLYGPTECAIDATFWPCPRDGAATSTVPIGRPIANDRVYLLDASLHLVPAGTVGELYVAGAGLARGYLDRPDLTAERFLPDPFAAEPGGRLYRTGDLARHVPPGRDPAGVLEIMGRADDQVKVRGVRIELGEVESWLLRHPGVAAAVAGVREGLLVAWVVPRGAAPAVPAAVTSTELRAFLAGHLPDAMVPSAFVTLPVLPRLGSGKIDRAALPAPSSAGAGSAAPRTPTEEVLAVLWAEVLGSERLGRHDNVYTLGWHSLLATQLVTRLRRAFGVEVPLRSLFEHPTVAALAERIDAALRGGPGLAPPPMTRASQGGEHGGPQPLSFAQQRLWFLDRLAPGNPFYNVPVTLRLTGALDAGALASGFSEVVRRHAVLRTSFPEVDEAPVQAVAPPAPVPLPVADLTALPEAARQAEARRLDAAEALRPFDLAHGPLLRTTLLRLAGQEHLLLLTMHHIVADGWSSQVLTREVREIYGALVARRRPDLPALPLQYADYARWQRDWLRGAVLDAQVGYWQRQLDGAPPALELPTDRPRPAVQSFRGATRSRLLPPEVAAAVRELAAREGVTPFMALLAAAQVLLGWSAGQDDVVVGTDVAGRDRPETEGLIGFFINQVALRTRLGGDPTFRELLARVRETTLGAYAHQELPFDKLVEALNPERSLGRAPVFQVKVNLLDLPPAALELPGLRIEPQAPARATAQFDWILNLAASEQGLLAWVEHATDLFDAATIDRMLGNFEALLRAATARPELRFADLAEVLEESDAAQRLAAQEGKRQGLQDRLRKSRRSAAGGTAAPAAVVAGEEVLP